VPDSSLTQGSPGIPGAAESGAKFGASAAHGIFNCQEIESAAIGSPGEDRGRAGGAGSVTLTPLSSTDGQYCAPMTLSQGHGLPGTAETGDAVGTALGSVDGDSARDEDRFDALLIGAPGEDIGTSRSHQDTGQATLWSGEAHAEFQLSGW